MVKAKKVKAEVEVEKPEIGLSLSPPAEEYHHVRLRSPKQFDSLSFRVIKFDKGIKATIGCPKGQYHRAREKCKIGTQIQKLMFPVDKYTKKEIKEWLKKHSKKLRLRKKKK